MSRTPTPTSSFALVVVRRDDGRFLVVHEAKHGQLWYLPAGRVEPGERFVDAAVRETKEESGVDVELTGLLRIEHTPGPVARLRLIFLARPRDQRQVPKAVADSESLEARYVSLEELAALPLRGDEVRVWFERVAAGAVVAPLSVLTAEGA